MLRFIAFVWNDLERERAAIAHLLLNRLIESSFEWQRSFVGNGLAVFHSDTRHRPSKPHVLSNGQGVVLGQVFPRSSTHHHAQSSLNFLSASPEIAASRGRKLIESFWGRYVAFLKAPGTRSTLILRDPTGALPCYFTSTDGVTVLFSSPQDCIALGLRFSVNWPYVAAHLLSSGWLECGETGLNEVSAVLAGECIEIGRAAVRRQFYWDPRRIATENILDDTQEAVVCLKQETRTCIQTWAFEYDCILHRLSGGLDSAIVLACLRGALNRPKVICLNYHSPGSNTDERTFARLAAQTAQYELIEQARSPCVSLERMLDVSKSSRPFTYWYSLHHSHIESQIARETGAGVVTSGEIGDGLFYLSPALPAAADYLATRGIGTGFLKVALDIAYLEGISIWRVLRTVLPRGLVSSPVCDPREAVLPFRGLVPKALRDREMRSDRFIHPWIKAAAGVPPGTQWHIHMMSVAFTLHPASDPLGRPDGPEQLPPLLSQPLIELCLRIPTWLHLKGGWDRAIARRAFRDEVPFQIVTRRTKGGQEEFVNEVLRRNIRFVRELLLDGALVREGLLDGKALGEILSLRPTTVRSLRAELYFYLCTEAWLRTWLSPALR